MKSSYYEVLGVSRNADDKQIKEAYRTMAKHHHPDVGGDAEVFKKITEAYDVLSNYEKRMSYDEKCWFNLVRNVYLVMPFCSSYNHKELIEELINKEWEIHYEN
jgi:curved DNA-binding protein CbpA